MKVLDLFSGIGGFSLGLERAGMETIAFCEFDKHAQKVLKKHWPEIPIHEDVRTLDGTQYRGTVDVVCGGFPCQDISVAGKQAGIEEGTRSGLWSECARIIGEVRPKYAIFENVTALLSGNDGRWFQRVLWDISQVGYNAEWHCIPASELGAHHHRDRVWIICYPNADSGMVSPEQERQHEGAEINSGICEDVPYTERNTDRPNAGAQSCAGNERQELQQENWKTLPGNFGSLRSNVADPERVRLQGIGEDREAQGQARLCRGAWWDQVKDILRKSSGWEIEPDVGRVADGVPDRSHRLKQLGNAVVPQIPEAIGRAIMQCES